MNNKISNLQSTLNSEQSHLNDLQGQLANLQAKKANVQFDLSQLTSDQQAEYNKAKDDLNTANEQKAHASEGIDNNQNVKDAQAKLDGIKNQIAGCKMLLLLLRQLLVRHKFNLTKITRRLKN